MMIKHNNYYRGFPIYISAISSFFSATLVLSYGGIYTPGSPEFPMEGDRQLAIEIGGNFSDVPNISSFIEPPEKGLQVQSSADDENAKEGQNVRALHIEIQALRRMRSGLQKKIDSLADLDVVLQGLEPKAILQASLTEKMHAIFDAFDEKKDAEFAIMDLKKTLMMAEESGLANFLK